jgi:hypothetical protein
MASFADYVKDLMGVLPQVNGNPMLSVTSMTDDNARYREDPFYRSREIQARDQLVLDEEERRRREAALSGSGMMTGGGEGGEGNLALTPEQEAYFDLQTQAEKDARMGQLQRMVVPAAIQGLMGNRAPVLSNLTNYNTRSEELQREQARQYVASQAAVNSGDFVRAGGGIVYANPQDVGPSMPSGGSGGGTGSYNESGRYGPSVDGLGAGGYQGVW